MTSELYTYLVLIILISVVLTSCDSTVQNSINTNNLKELAYIDKGDSLHYNGNLQEAFEYYTAEDNKVNNDISTKTKLAEISYWSKIIYSQDYFNTQIDRSILNMTYDSTNLSHIKLKFYTQYELNTKLLENIINQNTSNSNKDLIEKATAYQMIGEYAYKHKGLMTKGLKYFESSHKILQSLPCIPYIDYWNMRRISEINMMLRRNYKALNYANQMIHNYDWCFFQDNTHKGYAYATKGYLMFRFQLFGQSDSLNNKAIKLSQNIKGSPITQYALKGKLLTTINKNSEDSITYYQILKTLENEIRSSGYDYSNIHRWRAHYYFKNNQFKKALPHFKRSINYLINREILDIPVFDNQCISKSIAELKLGQFKQALNSTISADLLEVSHDYSFYIYENNNFSNSIFSFYSLMACSNIYLEWYKSELDYNNLTRAEILLENALINLNSYKLSMLEEELLIMLANSKSIYEVGMKIMYEKYLITNNPKYINKFIEYSEKSKYSTFYKQYLIKTNSNYSISLLQKEMNITQKLKSLKLKGFKSDIQLNKYIHEYDLIQDSLNKINDRIHSELLNADIPTLHNINKIKNKNNVIISTNAISDEIYLIILSTNSDTIIKRNLNKELKSQIAILNNFLHKNKKLNPIDYSGLSYSIYNSIFKNILNKFTCQNIHFINDPNLNIPSFDVLCYKINKNSISFSEINYLIKKHNIIYSPSIRFLINGYKNQILNTDNINLSAFSYSDHETIKTGCNNQLIELPHSFKEVEQIKILYPESKIYSGLEATKSNFTNCLKSKSINIIHIATHSISETEIRDKTSIYFRNGKCKIDTMYGFELLMTNTNIDLAIISSCQSNIGNIEFGVGSYSITNYLKSNGVQSVLGTTWNTNDYANSIYFKYFYEILLCNDLHTTYTNAKIKMIETPNLSHPYYWGGFILQI